MTLFVLPSALSRAIDALQKDLLNDDGPQISTVRNYNFAILPLVVRQVQRRLGYCTVSNLVAEYLKGIRMPFGVCCSSWAIRQWRSCARI